MNHTHSDDTAWNTQMPYTAMLREYRVAADKINIRLEELKQELARMQAHKAGTFSSSQAQRRLEQKMQMLREERGELAEDIRALRFYAGREVRS